MSLSGRFQTSSPNGEGKEPVSEVLAVSADDPRLCPEKPFGEGSPTGSRAEGASAPAET